MSKKLVDYLSELDTSESQWGLWVNPENMEDYRIGQFQFENGGMADDFVCIGSLDALSFGSQCNWEAFDNHFGIPGVSSNFSDQLEVKLLGDEHLVNGEALYEAWSDEGLAGPLQKEITEAIASIHEEWSRNQAEHFVDEKIPEILREAEAAQAELELIYGES